MVQHTNHSSVIWFDVGFLSDAQQLVFGAVLRYHGIFVLDCLQQKDYTSTVTILIIKFHNDGQFLLECNISIVTTKFFSWSRSSCHFHCWAGLEYIFGGLLSKNTWMITV